MATTRGSQKVTGEHAEETFDALSKFGVDLTKRAEESKLDPIIGRDEEIRPVRRSLTCARRRNYSLRQNRAPSSLPRWPAAETSAERGRT